MLQLLNLREVNVGEVTLLPGEKYMLAGDRLVFDPSTKEAFVYNSKDIIFIPKLSVDPTS